MFVLVFLLLFLILVLFTILLINFLLSSYYYKNKREKLTSFECGFDLFNLSRLPFSIHFYLVSILFLIFDIEVVLLIPMINSMNLLNLFSWFILSFILIMILYLGLEFEMNMGILKWIF